MNTAAEIILDRITDLHKTWKAGTSRRVAVSILSAMLANGATWPDEIPLAFVCDQDVNVIGTVWRRLAHAKFVKHTGSYRPSHAPRSNGRIVFEYQLLDPTEARQFLALCAREVEPARVQTDLL